MGRALSASVLMLFMLLEAAGQTNPLPKVRPQGVPPPPPADCSTLIIAAPRTVRAASPSAGQPLPRADELPPVSAPSTDPAADLETIFARLALAARNGSYDEFRSALETAKANVEGAAAPLRARYRSALEVYDDVDRIFRFSVTSSEGAFFNDQIFSGEYTRLSRAYPGYARFIEPFSLKVGETKLYPTSETRRFLVDEAERRLAAGAAARPPDSRPSESRPSTTEQTRTEPAPPATTTRPSTQRPSTSTSTSTRDARPATSTSNPEVRSSTTTRAESPSTTPTTSRPARSTPRTPTSRPPVTAAKPSPRPATSRPARSTDAAPRPATDDEGDSGVEETSDATAPADDPLTSTIAGETPDSEAASPNTSTTDATSPTGTSVTTGTEFDRSVEDLLRTEQQQPSSRKRSTLLLLLIAAIALVTFLLIFFVMKKREHEEEEKEKEKQRAVPPQRVDPVSKPLTGSKPAKPHEDSWVDPETKEWIDEVNQGKKKK